MDKFIIKNLKIFAYHGCNLEEKINGQNFFVNVTIYVKKFSKMMNDNLKNTLSYSSVVKTIIKTVTLAKYNLIETVAEAIARELFLEYNKVLKLKITVKKPESPIKAEVHYVAVKIFRIRDD